MMLQFRPALMSRCPCVPRRLNARLRAHGPIERRGHSRCAGGAELRLTSRLSQKQDQRLRNGHGDRMSMICFDEREREVDSGRDARGRPEATLVHEDALVDALGRRKSRTQFIEKAPMCRRTPTVEYAGFPEDEGARADAYQCRDPSMMLAKPSHQAHLGFGQGCRRRTAGNDRDLRQTAHLRRQRLKPSDDETVSRPQFGPAWTEQLNLVGSTSENVVGVPQDLPRSGYIEQLRTGRDKQPDTFP